MVKLSLNPFGSSPQARSRWIPEVAGAMRPRFDRLSRELKISETARENGVHNLPAKDDVELDAPQKAVGSAVQEGANLLKQFGMSQFAEAESKIRARQPRPVDPAFALAEARDVHGPATESLTGAQESLWLKQHDPEMAFRWTNGRASMFIPGTATAVMIPLRSQFPAPGGVPVIVEIRADDRFLATIALPDPDVWVRHKLPLGTRPTHRRFRRIDFHVNRVIQERLLGVMTGPPTIW